MDPKKSLKVVDLFAGCGGLSLGLENAGFFPVYVNELNDSARETYLYNRAKLNAKLSEARFHSKNVKEMLKRGYLDDLLQHLEDEWEIGDGQLDLVVGGPPCQGFSGLGHRRSYGVDRRELPSNHLYADMAKVIKKLRPKAFLFENVKGLISARWSPDGEKGEIWDHVWKTFNRIPGYSVTFSTVRAGDYGVPQNRPRVLMVGIRSELAPALPNGVPRDCVDAVRRGFLPAPTSLKAPNLIELLDDLADKNFQNGGRSHTYINAPEGIQQTLRTRRDRTIMKVGHELKEQEYSNHSERIVEKFRYMVDHNGAVLPKDRTKKFSQRLLPATWTKGPTITATSMPDDYVHYSLPRTLTVREWARLQLFPDWYEFRGPRTTGGLRRAGNPREGLFDREVPKYTQIGNAVPVGLAEAVGHHLARILKK